ncbi:MAG TPA: histidinol dehydrogenase [Syntrophales bacterium]|nr:histidinol dehydrogenase [Syntrophales bacterium]
MKIVRTSDKGFEKEFKRIVNRGKSFDPTFEKKVAAILRDVEKRGDRALFEYTKRFDGAALTAKTVEVSSIEIREALCNVSRQELSVLTLAAKRIESYHRRQRLATWSYREEGVELGQKIVPLSRVGIYAPGGLAAYPSTVLMAAIPARIAGVPEIVMTSPVGTRGVNPVVIAAAQIAGVDRIFKVGGAQAVAAMAYGTESIPAVDKIVGPGNAWVATAKKLVFGRTGIDMIAGPSEILVIADGSADPVVAAADLLSQAEHDDLASAILLTADEELAKRVLVEVKAQLKKLSRESIAAKAIRGYGLVIVTQDLAEAVEVANRFAPEHLELLVKDPKAMLAGIRNAGAVFLGHYTPEAMGDYLAGPNHILPTGGTARFSSPLGVYDFVKRISVLSFGEKSLAKFGKTAVEFAAIEGLEAHGKSILSRLKPKKS